MEKSRSTSGKGERKHSILLQIHISIWNTSWIERKKRLSTVSLEKDAFFVGFTFIYTGIIFIHRSAVPLLHRRRHRVFQMVHTDTKTVSRFLEWASSRTVISTGRIRAWWYRSNKSRCVGEWRNLAALAGRANGNIPFYFKYIFLYEIAMKQTKEASFYSVTKERHFFSLASFSFRPG